MIVDDYFYREEMDSRATGQQTADVIMCSVAYTLQPQIHRKSSGYPITKGEKGMPMLETLKHTAFGTACSGIYRV